SLYRISETLYGTNSPAASDMMFGGLIHLVEQLKGEVGNDNYDATLFRIVGFFSGLKNHGMLDVTQASWVDKMLGEFDDLKRNAGQNPQNLESQISKFQNTYLGKVKTLIDDYYIGVQVNGNGSLEFSMQTRQNGDNWARSQMIDRGAVRMLCTWEGGFGRVYAMIPVIDAIAPMEGIVGAGMGFDLFHSVWLPRLAFDAGVMTLTQRQTVTGFGQAAMAAYDNILEDASAYRKLVSENNLAKEGKFSELSIKEREAIVSNIKISAKGKASQDLMDATAALEEGENLKDVLAMPAEISQAIDSWFANEKKDIQKDTSAYRKLVSENNLAKEGKFSELSKKDREAIASNVKMPVEISQAIDSWFANEKKDIQKNFNGHTLVYSGASLYGLGNGQFYGDIGAFLEYADRLKSYIIVASRKDVTVYGGAEYSFDKEHSLGVIVGANRKKLSGGLSMSIKAGPGILTSYGILTNKIMPYTPPYARPYGFSTANDWVFGIIWTFGEGALKPVQAPRIEPNEGFGRTQH
ncbi:MAG: hypothetical protein NTY68_00475, partial [Candidatus Micrarchaeota archaeon]|nr:hypothetical protein [Candidatus Micrarchaeota archaeon]